MSAPLRLAFFGLPLGALCLLADGHELAFAALSPVEAPGRRRLSGALGAAKILDPVALGDAFARSVEEALRAERPDLIVSWFWTRKLPGSWLDAARLGGLNAHPSLLPRHRGPDPYFWAIDSGDAESGATVHRLSAEYDSGDLLLQERVPVAGRNAWQLARALDRPALRLLREAVRRYAAGDPPVATPQDEALATPAPAPEGDALKVDWSWPSSRILRRIRALSPAPGLALELGGLRFFVIEATARTDVGPPLEPGEASVRDRVAIRCADGMIAVERALIGVDADLEEGLEVDGPNLARLIAERLAKNRDL